MSGSPRLMSNNIMSASRSKRTLSSLALQLYEDGIMSAIISMSFPCTENLVRT